MKKLFHIIFCFIFVFIVLGCTESPPKPDTDLYFEFHHKLYAKIKNYDDKYNPFISAVKQSRTLEAIGMAMELEDRLLSMWSDIDRIPVPSLKNKDAHKKLNDAKKYITSAYLYKKETLTAYLEYSKNPSLYASAAIKNNADRFQALLLGGVASLYEAGSLLGLTPEEIQTGKMMTTASSSWKKGGLYPDAIKDIELKGNESNGHYKLHTVIDNISPEQIKQTLLHAFEVVIDRYPKYKSISIGICKNKSDADAEIYIATIDCDREKIILRSGAKKEIFQIEKTTKDVWRDR